MAEFSGLPGTESQPGLYSEFQASLGYTVRLCLKKAKKEKRKKKKRKRVRKRLAGCPGAGPGVSAPVWAAGLLAPRKAEWTALAWHSKALGQFLTPHRLCVVLHPVSPPWEVGAGRAGLHSHEL